MNQHKAQIEQFLADHHTEMLEKLEALVRVESCFSEIDHVAACLQWVKNAFEEEGFVCRIEGTAENHAGVVVGIWGEEFPGKPVLFTGHLDTVHPEGCFGEKIWHVEDGKLYGPGVLDMKGGIIMTLYVVKALKQLGFKERPIKIIWVSNEECDHTGTHADEILTRESSGTICAFNMEACLQGDKLCVYRKSLYNVFAKVTGIGGHSGNFFAQGRNAVLEAAQKTCHMALLTDMDKGSTVNVSVFHGGDAQAKIPETCEMVYDVRYSTPEEGKRLYDAVAEIMETAYVPDTTTEYEIEIPKFKALKDNEDVCRLLNFVNQVLADNDLPAFDSMKMGSCSDAGNVQAAGVPILDCCGIVGEYFHSLREYADEESLYRRTLIWTLVVLSLGSFM